ncbi:MAG: 2-amino-4-hydroxy-6-hydroxymethyldihydropteridine diphosphokinase [Crocinitomicaceae bacterium]|jgi:2-amino-4-hydroxy-6-hydroxymethyldihydropteridine diphosphokinase|nr:2-amino-4-hydroxy-6-hydroxymethyldihydropteridine diphosphokinase [Crocinitomicaceae bacterium]
MEVKMIEVVLALGSNIGDKVQNIEAAYTLIANEIGIITKKSSFLKNPSVGFESQNEFVNTCIKVETKLSCNDVLKSLQSIEKRMGRVKTTHIYEDRIIDIDIIFFGDLIINQPNLKIPHPRYHERSFVLQPLKELGETTDPRLNFK